MATAGPSAAVAHAFKAGQRSRSPHSSQIRVRNTGRAYIREQFHA